MTYLSSRRRHLSHLIQSFGHQLNNNRSSALFRCEAKPLSFMVCSALKEWDEPAWRYGISEQCMKSTVPSLPLQEGIQIHGSFHALRDKVVQSLFFTHFALSTVGCARRCASCFASTTLHKRLTLLSLVPLFRHAICHNVPKLSPTGAIERGKDYTNRYLR